MNVAIGLSYSLFTTIAGARAELDSHATRAIVIGDIHGCSTALDALLDAIRPDPRTPSSPWTTL